MSLYLLIPFLPLAAFLAIALCGRWLRWRSHWIGIPAIVLSCALSVLAFFEVLRNGPISLPLYTLLRSGTLSIDLGFYIDQLTVLLLLLVTAVSSLVHVYSSHYMQGDPRYARFFAVIALFTFSMLMLVMSSNLLMLYVFWEVMGLCSYLLISHWAERKSACHAATKAFLVNAVADVGLGFGVILSYATFGTLDIRQIVAMAPGVSEKTLNLLGWVGLNWEVQSLTVIALFLFMGAVGKSAQIPLHVWLPFAMEAPTPVSALIHAATMVNAGVFLLARLSPLFFLSPVTMTLIALVGASTALFAATVALTQSDIKRILAYSTMSQIGFMIMACGVGAFVAAIFHLLAHGALKAFLFLSAGNVLRTMAGEHDLGDGIHEETRHGLGGNWSLYVGALVLSCIPPFVIFSGQYETLWTSLHSAPSRYLFWGIGLTTAFFTAFYLFRWIVVLFGRATPAEWYGSAQPQDSRPPLAAPLLLAGVAAATVVLVVMLAFLWDWFVQFLSPAFGHAGMPTEGIDQEGVYLLWPILPVAVAVGGCGVAYYLHVKPSRLPRWVVDKSKTLYVLFLNKWYFDEVYEAVVVAPTLRFSHWLWRVIDARGVDRLVHGVGSVSVNLARWLWEVVDVRGIDRLVEGLARLSVMLARWLWQVVDVRVIDRMVDGLARLSITLARWLWQAIDVRGIDRLVDGLARLSVTLGRGLWHTIDVREVGDRDVDQVGHRADSADYALQGIEPRMLQHHLLVTIFWLLVGMALLYWFLI